MLKDLLTDVDLTGDGRPGVAVAGLPATLIVSGLDSQLSRSDQLYNEVDYLTPIMDAVRLLRNRHVDEPGACEEVNASVAKILARVARTIERDWGIDLNDLGLDPETAAYEPDVVELYQFFVAQRTSFVVELVYQTIGIERRRYADLFRKTVEKKNQTVSESRRVFQNFDDVVIWVSIPQIVEDLRANEGWSVGLLDALARIDYTPAADGAMLSLSHRWTDETFSHRYVLPVLSDREACATLVTDLRARWLNESPKKEKDGAADHDEQ
jgi:hypothetical protein